MEKNKLPAPLEEMGWEPFKVEKAFAGGEPVRVFEQGEEVYARDCWEGKLVAKKGETSEIPSSEFSRNFTAND